MPLENKKTTARSRIDGRTVISLQRRLGLRTTVWMEIHWVACNYGMKSESLIAQVLNWPFYSNDASVHAAIVYRLNNPDYKPRQTVLKDAKLYVNADTADRIGVWFEKYAPKIHVDWKARSRRDILAVYLEGAWDAWRKEFAPLAHVNPQTVRETDLKKLGFIFMRANSSTQFLQRAKYYERRVEQVLQVEGEDEGRVSSGRIGSA